MNDPFSLPWFATGIAVGIVVVAMGLIGLWIVAPWIRAYASGCPLLVSQLVGMRLRGVPPMTVVDAYVALRKLNVPTTLDHVQAFYLAHRANIKNEQDLVKFVRDHFEQNPPAD